MSLSVIKCVCVTTLHRKKINCENLPQESVFSDHWKMHCSNSLEKQVSWIPWWWKNLAFAVILGKKNALQNHQRQRSKGFHMWESSPTEPRIDVSFCFWDSPKGNFPSWRLHHVIYVLYNTQLHLHSRFAMEALKLTTFIPTTDPGICNKNSDTVDGSEIWQKSYQ